MSDKQQNSVQSPTDAATLRKHDEKQARTMEPISLSTQTPEENQRMLHELRVRQVELEMQYEELRTAQAQIDAERARYFDLYDEAPVGYCTLSEQGVTLEANLTAATLLGVTRDAMVRQPVSRFIHNDDQDIYALYHKQLLETGTLQKCDLRLVKPDGGYIWAHLKGTAAHVEDGAPLCRVVIIDITERKRAEEALEKRIMALTQPLDNPEGIGFEELFNSDELQRLQDEFSRATGVASVITHPDGVPITKPSNFCRLCIEIIRTTEIGCANCFKSDAVLGRPNPTGPTVQTCLSGGLWDAGAAIFVGDRHIANWLIGQVRDEEQAEDKIRAYARVIGADEEAAVEAFWEVPAMSRRQFEQVANVLFTLANQISKSAWQNVQHSRFLTERKRAEEVLIQSVEERSILLDTIQTQVWYLIDDHTYGAVNKAHADFNGVKIADMAYKNMYDIFPKDIVEVCRQGNVEVFTTGKPVRSEEWVPHVSGDRRLISILKSPKLGANGTVEYVVCSAEDVTERKRVEEKLKTNEEFRKRVFESSRIPIVVMDVETCQYLDCNPAAVAIYRYSSKEETTGKTPLDVSASVQHDGTPSKEKALSYRKQALDRGSVVFEWLHKRPDGELWDAEVHLQSFNVAGRKMMQFSLVDITDRKRAEKALMSSVSLLTATLESTEDGILTVNRSGKVEQWNKRFLELWKIPIELAIEKDDEKLLQYVADRVQKPDEFFARVKNLYDNPEEIGFDVIAFADGRWLERYSQPRRLEGKIIGRVWSFRDITARKKAEEELRRSEERYRSIITVSNTGAWEYHQNTDYLWCSPEYFTMIDRDPGEFVMDGRANLKEVWVNLIHPDDRQTTSERFREYLRGGSVGMYENFFRFQAADGEWAWIWSRGQTLRNGDGSATDLTVGTHIDITERKREEEERAMLQEQLIQAQKMETIGLLAGGVAHDFNNMLGVILGYAEMTMEQVSADQPMYKALHGIQQAAQRSADLTLQLLAFARKQTIAPKVIDLNETVEGMLKMLCRLIGEDIDLIWLPGRNLRPVKMDPTQIDQILANLCVNSRDAIKGVGKITIETSNIVVDAEYCARHSGFLPGEYVLLVVSDNGCGMDRETISHLFEPFFTTKEQGKGTGLGLASVYGAVKQNSGFINVYSEPGQGTTFKIYLPRYAATTEPLPKQFPVEAAARGHETILLVEDEPAILEMTSMMLKTLGYTAVAAATPGNAVRLAQEYSGSIDLLITDVVMPEMNGRELAGNLLTHYPDLKRLFMSGYTANVIAHHGVLDEGVHFIQKPFLMTDLAAKIREALGE